MRSSRDEKKTMLSSHAQNVLLWRNALTKLPDNHFFELMRIYLGEIKTPYNKQNLIENLGAFLHKPEIQQRIVSLLSVEDIQIINAIHYLTAPSQNVLSRFFAKTVSFAELYEALMNLEERLIIFRYTHDDGSVLFKINPILEQVLTQFFSLRTLIPQPQDSTLTQRNTVMPHRPLPAISPQFLATIFAFVQQYPDIFRQDGSLKKRSIQGLFQLFSVPEETDSAPLKTEDSAYNNSETGNPVSKASTSEREKAEKFFHNVLTALKNLSLLKTTKKGLVPDYDLWMEFAKLSEENQQLYLAAAACGWETKNQLKKRAFQASQLLSLCPSSGLTEDTFYRLEFLIKNSDAFETLGHATTERSPLQRAPGIPGGAPARQSRLSQLINQAQKRENTPETEPSKTEEETSITSEAQAISLVESLIDLGLLCAIGTAKGLSHTQELLYTPTLTLSDFHHQSAGHITLDTAFRVTILPGLTLKQLLPLVRFMAPIQFDTASTFEITKNSCVWAFEAGLEPHSLISLLESYLSYPLPQNLLVSLEDWFQTYSAVTLYRGYILLVKNNKRIEENPLLSPYIFKKLADTIYLMNFEDDNQAEEIIAQSGYENSGTVKKASEAFSPGSFYDIPRIRTQDLLSEVIPSTAPADEQKTFFHIMEEKLYAMHVPKQQEEVLLSRIHRKILLTEKQLQPNSVKPEVLEAFGMDFLGKVHVTETAIATETMLELKYSAPRDGKEVFLGLPLAMEKYQGDTFVVLLSEPDKQRITCSLNQATSVRRLRGAIFKE